MLNRSMDGAAVGWAGRVFLAGLLVACSSGGGASQPSDDGSSNIEPPAAATRDVSGADGIEVRYQFVDTPEGMTVEAVSADQVLTQSCPTRTCAGLCDECAAAACRAAGELAGVCERLRDNCTDACSCAQTNGQEWSCGFPICATNRNLCYIGGDDPAPLPVDPAPDPNTLNPVSRPSGASQSGSPSSSGANAAQPAG